MLTAYNAEPRRHRSPKSSHRSYPSAHGGVPARQAAHPLTGSKPSCSHSTAYLSHSLKNIQRPPTPALLPKQRGRYYTFNHPAHLRRNSASQAYFNHSHPTSTPLHQQSVTSLPSPQALNLTTSIPSHRKQQRSASQPQPPLLPQHHRRNVLVRHGDIT